VLIHYGKIDEAQLQTAMERQRTFLREQSSVPHSKTKEEPPRLRLGQILVAEGILTDADISQVLEIRTLDIIYDLFLWKEGHFEFVTDNPLPADFTRVALSTTKVIMDGAYRADELARYRTLIPSDRTILELNAGWTSSLQSGQTTRQLLFFVEKRMSVAEISYNMHCSPFEVYAQLYELVRNGIAVVAGEAPETPDPVAQIPNLPDETSELLLLARRELDGDQVEKALSIIQSVLRRDPKNTAAQKLLVEAEHDFVDWVYSKISPTAVPNILVLPDDLAQYQIGPQEGFIISRINGAWDIQSILSICPFREADSLQMILTLIDQGIIELEGQHGLRRS
ncbi:MAG TPA: DUF4388 domain-containing protein, partial [Pyrinomonadaceae bacterium]|nr:DUF4388 domain-containing protein [Pyrinomonadaceae bacterium]